MIAKQLTDMGCVNKKGLVEWHASGVMGIIKNEKYKGDVILGKTYTVDPISKRRLENFGEEDRYYIEDHHEPIVSKEVWRRPGKSAKVVIMERFIPIPVSENAIQGSILSAACVNAVTVVISYPEGQGIRQQRNQSRYGSV